jgi:hypothetical protein
MADPQDRPDEGSDPGPPAKVTPKKAPANKAAAKKVPAKKVPAKKVPAKKAPAKKAPAKKAAPRTAPTETMTAPPTADTAPHDARAATPPPIRGVGHPVSPPGPPARSGRYTRVPIAIGLAAASAGAMLIRRLRRG